MKLFKRKQPTEQTAPDPNEKSQLDQLIDDMTVKAGMAAHDAWKICDKTGYAGALPLPPADHPARALARKYFLIGYGMALVDHTMEATKRMQAAANHDQDQNLKKFIV